MKHPARYHAGFTLIEILVVMLLIAVMAAAIALSIGQGNQRRELLNEAERFHAVLRMASDEAVFQNVEIGVHVDHEGYDFVAYNEEKKRWTQMPQDFLRAHSFPDWLELDFNREGQEIQLPTGKDDKEKPPQFILLSSGESTPFRIAMEVKGDQDYSIKLSTDGINAIQIQKPGDEE